MHTLFINALQRRNHLRPQLPRLPEAVLCLERYVHTYAFEDTHTRIWTKTYIHTHTTIPTSILTHTHTNIQHNTCTHTHTTQPFTKTLSLRAFARRDSFNTLCHAFRKTHSLLTGKTKSYSSSSAQRHIRTRRSHSKGSPHTCTRTRTWAKIQSLFWCWLFAQGIILSPIASECISVSFVVYF